MKLIKLVEDGNGRILGILGEKSATPDSGWLAIQNTPFAEDASFYTVYPLSGGAMLIDMNISKVTGQPTTDQLNVVLGRKGNDFNPAADTIIELYDIQTLPVTPLQHFEELQNHMTVFHAHLRKFASAVDIENTGVEEWMESMDNTMYEIQEEIDSVEED